MFKKVVPSFLKKGRDYLLDLGYAQRVIMRLGMAALGLAVASFWATRVEALTLKRVETGATPDNTRFFVVGDGITKGGALDPTTRFFMDTEAGYHLVSLTDTSDRLKSVELTVTSDRTFTVPAGKSPVVVLEATSTSATPGFKAVPIAFRADESCQTSTLCQNSVAIANYGTRFFAARYNQGETLKLSFFLKDICVGYDAQSGGTPAGGCDATTDQPAPVAASPGDNGSVATIQMRARILFLDTNATGYPTDTTDADGPTLFYVTVQLDGLKLTGCTDVNSTFFPGDEQIFIEKNPTAGALECIGCLGTDPTLTDRAQPESLIVLGKRLSGGAPVGGPSMRASNDVVATLPIGFSSTPVDGFFNSTDSSDNPYTLAFLIRDSAGLVAYNNTLNGDTNPTCKTTNPVRASEVLGFLRQGNCLIATAAYDDTDAWAVELLREFRDEVLQPTAVGAALVRAYYRNSGPIAEWVVKNQWARYPLLVGLAPIVFTAFLVLHPLYLVCLMLLAGGLAIGLVRWRMRSEYLAGH